MDGRKLCCLLAFLATALAGCDNKRLLPVWPSKTPKDIDRTVAVPLAEPGPKEPIALKPETLVAMAGVWEQQAIEPNVTQQQREYFRDQARRAYQRALGIDAKCPSAHLGLARLYETVGNHDRAMESYNQVLQLEPKNAALYYEIGMTLARRKEWDRSLNMLAQAAELDPDNRAMIRSYGLALARAGRIPDSLRQLQLVLSEAEAHCMIARMMHHMQQEGTCRHHLQVALQLDANLAAAKELQAELQGARQPAVVNAAHRQAAPPAPEPEPVPPPTDPEPVKPDSIDLETLDSEADDLYAEPAGAAKNE